MRSVALEAQRWNSATSPRDARAADVVHVCTARGWRGGEQQVADLASRLAGLGVTQRIVCVSGSAMAQAALERGVAPVPLPRRLGIDPLFARGLASAARRARVVHAHDAHAHAAAVLGAMLFGLRAPVVVHRRVDFPVGRSWFSRWKYAHPSIRRVVCVSRVVADMVRVAVRDPGRLVVVHDGVELGRFPSRRGCSVADRVRAELEVPRHVPLVGNVAALVDHKDHATFLAAAGRITATGSDAHFVLVGAGPLRAELVARARALGIGDRVHFTGFRRDVPDVLTALDVLLFTSKTEGLGSSILEAWAGGVPVVATAAGGVPELVVDGETGLLAPVGCARTLAAQVACLLADPSLRQRLVAGGKERLRDFDAAAVAERILAIYREVWREEPVIGTASESPKRAFGSFRMKSRFQR